MLNEAREDINELSPWPADNKLFTIDHKSPFLAKNNPDYIHMVTAFLSFVCKQARLDIQVAVAFICKWVKDCTEEDYIKLARVIKYIHNTIH